MEEDDENGRDPLAPFARSGRGTRGEKDGMFSTLHAGAQTNRGTRSLFLSGGCGGGGTKSLRLPPRPSLAALSISVYLSFSTTAFFPHFPLRLSRRQSPAALSFATAAVAAFLSLSLPFRHGGPTSSFFSSRYASFYATAQPWSVLVSRSHLSPSLFLPFSTVLPLTPELNHLRRFFADTVPAAPLSLRRANRSRTRASEREDSNREQNEQNERERGKRRWNPSTVYTRASERASENAPRESGAREREAGGKGGRIRGDVPAKSDGIRRGRKEEEEGEKRRMVKRRRASGMPRERGGERDRER